jgi:signal recognition particle receptor subunit beta
LLTSRLTEVTLPSNITRVRSKAIAASADGTTSVLSRVTVIAIDARYWEGLANEAVIGLLIINSLCRIRLFGTPGQNRTPLSFVRNGMAAVD